jgi:Asp-tRNA(Asn)/Glu-tRNA(Gln) amidotransferase A subunit family amidase
MTSFASPHPSRDFAPAFATAVEAADAIRTKRISATELLHLTFRRVELHNPTINAIIWQISLWVSAS